MTNQTQKPLIHFAHATGIPSIVYQSLFERLQDDFDICYVPQLGTNLKYPVDNHWQNLTQQVIDNIRHELKQRGQNPLQSKVIGLGHSLGSMCTLLASYREPQLFSQVICLDPPLIHGKDSLILHWAKAFSPKTLDTITPAHLSLRRRDVWDSREQAYEKLRNNPFYQDFDERCFADYIRHALSDTHDGRVTLTIPKAIEVAIFRTNPSLFWLKPNHPPVVPVKLIVGEDSRFYKKGYPSIIKNRIGIDFEVHQGGHMFPLEYPESTVERVKAIIKEQMK